LGSIAAPLSGALSPRFLDIRGRRSGACQEERRREIRENYGA
jgi:hypothetical protein